MFTGQRILITGASGFLGSHLCARLRVLDREVHAVSRKLRTKEGIHWWQADLSGFPAVKTLMERIRPDIVFHLAGDAVGSREREWVLPLFRGHVMSTVNLLTVAADTGCRRLVLAGSLEEPDASDPCVMPNSPYAAAKWTATAYARMFHALYALPVVMLRVFMVYGPGQPRLQKLIPYVILSLLRGEKPRLSSGTRQIDWVYIDDVVDALLAAAQVDRIEGESIDVGSGQLISIRQLVEKLCELIDPQCCPPFGRLSERPMEQVRAADAGRSRRLLGWQSSIPLEEGLRRTVAWYRRHAAQAVRR